MDKKTPAQFGNYLLLEPIKCGGMSEIWRAQPQGDSTVVAIKRVLPEHADDPEILGMFLDEAKVAVQLSHPNIVRVFDLGRVGEDLYIAMEYVPGSDLRAIFRRATSQGTLMPIPLAVFVLEKVCQALDHAHRRTDAAGSPMGIVHRDVTPDNCLITFDGEVKLIDFGVAKASVQSEKTRAGVLKGKLSYMSPEQVLGKGVDRRSDLFSLGVVLYEMVTGKRLFWHDSPLLILEAVVASQVEPPSQVNPKVPQALEKIILKALARDREQRWEWASDMAAALQAFLAGLRTPPNAAQLRKYMSLMFVDELDAERERRTRWAKARSGAPSRGTGPVPTLASAPVPAALADEEILDGEPLEGEDLEGDGSPSPGAGPPTLLEPPKRPRPAPPRKPAPPPPRAPEPEDEDVDVEDRPTVLQLEQLPDLELPDDLLNPGEALPPPIPGPERPTLALQAFVNESRPPPPKRKTGPIQTPASAARKPVKK